MIKNKKLAASLIFSILFLAGLAIYKAIKTASGKEIAIPITGYDPRDLLSGHYLTYRLDLNNICSDEFYTRSPVNVCIRQAGENGIESSIIIRSGTGYTGCDSILKGKCKNGNFTAGIERFYIPEKYSMELERIIKKGKARILISVDGKGNPTVKDLLIDGVPWREYLQNFSQ